jgi:predicted nucleic acid-binding Zn ribbon protein
MKNRTCPVCNSAIFGRSDKKFCSDQCRSIQNNASRNTSESLILEINKYLRKNRTILKKLCPTGKAVVPKTSMMVLDFQFQLFTSTFVTKDGKTYFVAYDFAFTALKSPE